MSIHILVRRFNNEFNGFNIQLQAMLFSPKISKVLDFGPPMIHWQSGSKSKLHGWNFHQPRQDKKSYFRQPPAKFQMNQYFWFLKLQYIQEIFCFNWQANDWRPIPKRRRFNERLPCWDSTGAHTCGPNSPLAVGQNHQWFFDLESTNWILTDKPLITNVSFSKATLVLPLKVWTMQNSRACHCTQMLTLT